MSASTETLTSLSKELASLVARRKEITQQEDEVKRQIMEELELNNLTVWSIDEGRVASQSRITYKDWDLDAIRQRVGEYNFPEVTNTTVKVSALRSTLENMGVGDEEAALFFSTAATQSESKWVVFRPKT
jgi:hypothetical protein